MHVSKSTRRLVLGVFVWGRLAMDHDYYRKSRTSREFSVQQTTMVHRVCVCVFAFLYVCIGRWFNQSKGEKDNKLVTE